MVSKLTSADNVFLNETLQEAERTTSGKIALVVLAASGSYHSYILSYGICAGSLISLLLWAADVTSQFPLLLAVQLGVIVVCDVVHCFSTLLVRLVPRKVKQHYASHEAMREYHARHPAEAPFALLFVSLAERYVHVVTNPVVHGHIPGDWHTITDAFARSIRHQPLRTACAEAITGIGQKLSTGFPP